MRVHLLDGTFELFRHHHALPTRRDAEGREVGAVRGVLGSAMRMLEEGATHLAVATDRVIESFRNRLFAGYKTGEGIEPELLAQFGLLEEGLQALGLAVLSMVEFQADDALATAAARAAADPRVEQVLLCTPDKDLAQCVAGKRVVQLDRMRGIVRDEAAIRRKFGVAPASIPDYLALVGDGADGIPGLPGWGPRSAAAVLARHPRLEEIPADPARWAVRPRGAARLASVLRERAEEARLYRLLATLVRDVPGVGDPDCWRWRGPRPGLEGLSRSLAMPQLWHRATRLAERRAGAP